MIRSVLAKLDGPEARRTKMETTSKSSPRIDLPDRIQCRTDAEVIEDRVFHIDLGVVAFTAVKSICVPTALRPRTG